MVQRPRAEFVFGFVIHIILLLSKDVTTAQRTLSAKEVVMPLTDAKVFNWLKQVGDHVEVGSNLLTLEQSDHVRMDVQSFEEGYVAQILVPTGSAAKAGDVLALLVDARPMVEVVGLFADAIPHRTDQVTNTEAALPHNSPVVAVVHPPAPSMPQQVSNEWVSQYDVNAKTWDAQTSNSHAVTFHEMEDEKNLQLVVSKAAAVLAARGHKPFEDLSALHGGQGTLPSGNPWPVRGQRSSLRRGTQSRLEPLNSPHDLSPATTFDTFDGGALTQGVAIGEDLNGFSAGTV